MEANLVPHGNTGFSRQASNPSYQPVLMVESLSTAKRMQGLVCIALLCFCRVSAFGQNQEGFLRDSLTPAVKTEYLMERRISGGFHVNMKDFMAKAWSPVGENDPVKFVMTLPGVSSGAEGFSAFFVRGGNLGNNLVTLDGVRIYGYSHLLGLTTALPSDAISDMDFRMGGFSGDQGGLTASHVSLHSVNGDYTRTQGAAAISNTFLSASFAAPVIRDRVSVFAAARYSPFGLEYRGLRAMSGKTNLPSLTPRVGDLFVKVNARIAPKQEAFASFFGSDDAYHIGFKNSSYDLGWTNGIGHIGYRYTGRITHIRVDIAYNYFKNRQAHEAAIQKAENELVLQSMIREQDYSADARHSFFDGLFSVAEGIKVQKSFSTVGTMKKSGLAANIDEDIPFTESIARPVTTSLWIEAAFNWRNRIQLMANLRRNWYNNHADRALNVYSGKHNELSVRATFQPLKHFGVEMTYDRRIQFSHTLEGTPLGWSIDLIIPSTYMVRPEEVWQYYAGLFSSFGHSSLSVGGYYKQMQNLAYYIDAQALFTAGAATWTDNVRFGSGNSYGVELHYEIHGEHLDGALSYTWSKTDRLFPYYNWGRPFPAKFDRRNILNAHMTCILARSQRTEHSLSLSACLQNGHYETIAQGTFGIYLPDGLFRVPYYDSPNNYQMPFYSRLDAGYQIRFLRKREHTLSLGVFNVLNRHNPSMLSYDAASRTWYLISFFPVMPNLKYSLAF